MQLDRIIEPARIRCHAHAASKKRALEQLAELLAEGEPDNRVTPHAVFDCLIARERLGSTGLGFGVAIPHGRMSRVQVPVGAFLSVQKGVDFDSPDGGRVDLVFGLLVPEDSTEEHLLILSKLAELFNDDTLRDRLRDARTPDAVLECLTGAQS